MSRQDREAFATKVSRDLAQAVVRDCIPGLGAWNTAWDLVEEPSGRLMKALHGFVETGKPTQQEIVALGKELLDSWKQASERYKEQQSS